MYVPSTHDGRFHLLSLPAVGRLRRVEYSRVYYETEPRPARMPTFNTDLESLTFQFDDWTFTLPQMDEKFFDQGVLDTACFSKAFATQNGQHVVAKSVIFAAVGHFVVHHFPDTAAELFINFRDQVS